MKPNITLLQMDLNKLPILHSSVVQLAKVLNCDYWDAFLMVVRNSTVVEKLRKNVKPFNIRRVKSV